MVYFYANVSIDNVTALLLFSMPMYDNFATYRITDKSVTNTMS